MKRFLIYRSDTAKHFLCICSARDKAHALKIARQIFFLSRTAYAVPEVVS